MLAGAGGAPMFDRFTDHARKAMSQARLAALRFNHDYIDAPHMLLGLLATEGCGALGLIGRLGGDCTALRAAIERQLEPGRKPVTQGQLPFTPTAKKVLELAMYEAADLCDNHLGSEHLLLGMLRTGKGIAGQTLREAGIELEAARAVLGEDTEEEAADTATVWAADPPF